MTQKEKRQVKNLPFFAINNKKYKSILENISYSRWVIKNKSTNQRVKQFETSEII